MPTGYSPKITRIATDSCFLLCALALSYVETFVPVEMLIPLPGAKLGLANIAVLLTAHRYGMKDAAAVSLTRVLLSSLLFGSLPSLAFSLTGAIFALLVLAILRAFPKLPCSFVGISVLTAAAHNLGQLAAAVLTYREKALFSYLPALLGMAVIFGTLTGFLTNLLVPRLQKRK